MEEISRMLKTFGDINRLRILKLVEKNPLCVCELSRILGITQPSVSKHIKLLAKEGMVAISKKGSWRWVHLAIENPKTKVLFSNISMWLLDHPIVRKDVESLNNGCRNEKLNSMHEKEDLWE